MSWSVMEMIRPATPAIIRITPMSCRSTCAGCQRMPHLRMAPMTMSAMLPPIVIATSFSELNDAPEQGGDASPGPGDPRDDPRDAVAVQRPGGPAFDLS